MSKYFAHDIAIKYFFGLGGRKVEHSRCFMTDNGEIRWLWQVETSLYNGAQWPPPSVTPSHPILWSLSLGGHGQDNTNKIWSEVSNQFVSCYKTLWSKLSIHQKIIRAKRCWMVLRKRQMDLWGCTAWNFINFSNFIQQGMEKIIQILIMVQKSR